MTKKIHKYSSTKKLEEIKFKIINLLNEYQSIANKLILLGFEKENAILAMYGILAHDKAVRTKMIVTKNMASSFTTISNLWGVSKK